MKVEKKIEVKKDREESMETAYKVDITIIMTTNEKRPVTVSYTATRKNGSTYESGEKQYALKKHNDGNYYISLNVGVGYKKLKLNINELVNN